MGGISGLVLNRSVAAYTMYASRTHLKHFGEASRDNEREAESQRPAALFAHRFFARGGCLDHAEGGPAFRALCEGWSSSVESERPSHFPSLLSRGLLLLPSLADRLFPIGSLPA